MDFSFSDLNFNSVVTLPGFEARAAFTVNSASVFKEDVDMVPTIIDDTLSCVPWGGDNQMPFDLLALVEKDETLATCQCFNAKVCYGWSFLTIRLISHLLFPLSGCKQV